MNHPIGKLFKKHANPETETEASDLLNRHPVGLLAYCVEQKLSQESAAGALAAALIIVCEDNLEITDAIVKTVWRHLHENIAKNGMQ